jgi:hypothetical protein
MDLMRSVMSGLIATVVVLFLMRSGTKRAQRFGDRRILTYSTGFRLFAVAFVPISAFVAYAATQARPSQLIIALSVATGFLLGTGYLVYQAFMVRFSYDDDKIYYSSPMAGTHVIPWSDVREVGYSHFLQCDYIVTAQVSRIWCSKMLQGYEELGEFLGEKLKDRIVSA